MGDQAQLNISLQISKDDATGIVNYRAYPTQFTADVDGAMGPTPGAFQASVFGTAVDLSELTSPGFCRISNLDPTNFVTWGIRDPDTDLFYPCGKILSGEFYVIRLSESLGQVWSGSGTGTGTAGSSNKTFTFYADTAACNVLVEAFEA